jgi:ATPase subunit of ABC transporter with duplicated ATPase domains
MNPVITVHSLSFEFPNGRELFSGLNFSLVRERTALVGPNGIGKSTLVRLLSGELEASAGDVRRLEPVVHFRQRETPPVSSVTDFLGAGYEWSALSERLLEGIDRAKPCSSLSGGEWMRARLARALGSGFLILDEPTNDLDREGREALLAFLRGHEGGLLLISHDREALALCDSVLELSTRGLMKFGGTWEGYLAAKEIERAALNRTLETAKRERGRAAADRRERTARQEKRNRAGAAAAARGGMPKILLGGRKRRAQVSTGKVDAETAARAEKAVQEAHEALAEVKIDPVMYAGLLGEGIPAQKLVAEARGFNIRFEGWLFPQDLNFAWRGNLRMALKGKNGSGKSTLLAALMARSFETRGELRSGSLRTLYIDQRASVLDESKSVFENVRENANLTDAEIRNGLAKFLFMKEAVFQKVSELSGGERLRAALARGFLGVEKPELLILDEPTNNLDLANVEFLEGLAREFPGALIAVSHDEVFLRNCGITESLDLA